MLSRVLTGEPGGRVELLILPQASSSSIITLPVSAGMPEPAPVADRVEEIAALQLEIQNGRERAAQIERDAFARGRQQGHAEAQAELHPVLERLNGSIAETLGLRSQLRRSAERDVVLLSLAIAKRILHRELQIDESALGALARFAFDRIGRAERYQILVHPKFASNVEQSLLRRPDVSIRVDADPGCAPGTLVIRTEHGALDASIDHQLEEISKGLADRIT